jgi:zinc protease
VVPPVTDGRLLARLPNGLTVLVVEDKRFPLVAERLYVHAGSAYESKGQEGISHLLEHMVFNSTAKREKGGVAAAIEGAGGDTNAATSFDYTQYMADLPSQHWKLGLEVFEDMIFGAKFDPAELEQEKKVVISELERGLDEPGQRLFKMSQEAIWKALPYHAPIIGHRETVNAITPEDLRAYVRRFYQPQSMLLVVVGDVDAAAVYQEAMAVFGGLDNDRTVVPPELEDLPANTGGPSVNAAAGAWNKCYLRLGFAVPGMHSAKDAPLEVLADLIGGGRTSRLYRKLVYELQLADKLDVSSITLERGGMLSLEATVDPARLDAFWDALTRELAALKASEFTPRELERAKLNIEDHLLRARETLRGLATKLAYYQFFGFGLNGEANSLYEVRNADVPMLQGLLDEYVTPANVSVSLLLPGQDQAQADETGRKMMSTLAKNWPGSGKARAQADSTGKALAPEVVEFGGGRAVVLLPDPTMPYASLTLSYRGGDGLLPPDRQGLSELTAKALTRSTASMDAVGLQDFLADRAASMGASAGRDTFTVSAAYPSRFAPDALKLFSEVILTPAFDPAEVARARKIQLAQIAETKDRPTSLAFRRLFPFIYPTGHYGYYRAGQPEDVERYGAGDARALWERQRTMPWVMSVCGVFDREAVLELAAKLAAAGEGTPPPFGDPAWGTDKELNVKLAERNQTHLFWVFPLPGKDDPDTPALEVLKSALAGQGGLLFQDLRDKRGLGYSVTAFLWQAPKTGLMAFYIGTTPEQEGAAMEGFKRVASELAAKGLAPELVERAKNSLEGDYYQERQSLSSRSSEAASNLVMGYPLDFEREMLGRARALSGEQITAAARKWLDPGKAYLLKIEP